MEEYKKWKTTLFPIEQLRGARRFLSSFLLHLLVNVLVANLFRPGIPSNRLELELISMPTNTSSCPCKYADEVNFLLAWHVVCFSSNDMVLLLGRVFRLFHYVHKLTKGVSGSDHKTKFSSVAMDRFHWKALCQKQLFFFSRSRSLVELAMSRYRIRSPEAFCLLFTWERNRRRRECK